MYFYKNDIHLFIYSLIILKKKKRKEDRGYDLIEYMFQYEYETMTPSQEIRRGVIGNTKIIILWKNLKLNAFHLLFYLQNKNFCLPSIFLEILGYLSLRKENENIMIIIIIDNLSTKHY